MSLKHTLSLHALLVANIAYANAEARIGPEKPPRHPAHVELSIKPGNKRTLKESDFFLPIAQDENNIVFGSVRGMLDTKKQKEGNAGVGYRHLKDENIILGAYGHGDIRRSKYGNTFYQATVGAEALTEFFDIRANGYLPLSKKRLIAQEKVAQVTNNLIYIYDRNLYEQPLKGFDVEAGFLLPLGKIMNANFFFTKFADEVRGYGAFYYFHNKEGRSIYGSRARFEMTKENIFNNYDLPLLKDVKITIGGEISHDKVHGTHRFFEFRLRIPLNYNPSDPAVLPTGLRRRLSERIVRDVDVVSGENVAQENPTLFNPAAAFGIDGPNGSNIYWVDFDAPAGGDGSFNKPGNDIPNTANTIALVIPGREKSFSAGIGISASNLAIIGLQELILPDNIKSFILPNDKTITDYSRTRSKILLPQTMLAMYSGSNQSLIGIDLEGGENLGTPVVLDFRSNNGHLKNVNITVANESKAGMFFRGFSSNVEGSLDNVTISSYGNVHVAAGIRLNTSSAYSAILNLKKVSISSLGGGTPGSIVGSLGAASLSHTINITGGCNFSNQHFHLTDAAANTHNINISTIDGPNNFTATDKDFTVVSGTWNFNTL